MELERLKQMALDHLPVSVFVFDRELRVSYVNRTFERNFSPHCPDTVGNAVGCARARAGEPCGEGPRCSLCKLRGLLTSCVSQGDSRTEKVSQVVGEHARALTYRATAAPLPEDFFICLLEDISDIQGRMDEAATESRQLVRDIEKAQDIQSRLLPNPMDVFSLCDFIYLYQQQYRVGGDFFDIYKIDDHTFGAYIADVSGSGVSGGLITVFLSDNLDKTTKSPARALYRLNEKFKDLDMGEESYITIFAMVFDKEMGTIRYCNGGHNQPAILKRGEEIRTFECDGAPISNWGIDFRYKDYALQYRKGDKLVLYTDGVADIKNSEGEPFGLERIVESVREAPNDMNLILNHLAGDVKDFYGKEKVTDDITLLVLDLK